VNVYAILLRPMRRGTKRSQRIPLDPDTDPVGLLALRALHRLLVEHRVGYCGLAVDELGQRDGHFHLVSLMHYIISRMAATTVIAYKSGRTHARR
jgi:hypothetical protein